MDVMTVLRSQWDRVAAGACVLLGLVLLVLGYQGVATSPYVAQELAYLISGGLGGLFLLGVGATLSMSADMHDEWRKLDRIEDAIRSLSAADAAVGHPRTATASVPAVDPAVGGAPDLGAELGSLIDRKPAARRRRRAAPGTAAASVDSGVSLRDSIERFEHGPSIAGAVLPMPLEVRNSLRVSAATMTFAVLVVALAYTKAANVSQAKPAITATAAAAVALIVAGVGSAAGTLGLRRRLTLRRAALLYPFVVRRQANAKPVSTAPSTGDLLMIEGGTYAHAHGCSMLAGEPTTPVPPDRLPSGVRHCALCLAQG